MGVKTSKMEDKKSIFHKHDRRIFIYDGENYWTLHHKDEGKINISYNDKEIIEKYKEINNLIKMKKIEVNYGYYYVCPKITNNDISWSNLTEPYVRAKVEQKIREKKETEIENFQYWVVGEFWGNNKKPFKSYWKMTEARKI